MYGLELDRSVLRVQGRGHIVAASRLQLAKFNLIFLLPSFNNRLAVL